MFTFRSRDDGSSSTTSRGQRYEQVIFNHHHCLGVQYACEYGKIINEKKKNIILLILLKGFGMHNLKIIYILSTCR